MTSQIQPSKAKPPCAATIDDLTTAWNEVYAIVTSYTVSETLGGPMIAFFHVGEPWETRGGSK